MEQQADHRRQHVDSGGDWCDDRVEHADQVIRRKPDIEAPLATTHVDRVEQSSRLVNDSSQLTALTERS